jgi:glycerophosphoryl diester phosphodiesterase
MSTKVLGSYTPMDIDGIVQLMRDHPDIYFITDTKYGDAVHVRQEFRDVLRAMGPDAPTLTKRLIVQFYGEGMLSLVKGVYPFQNFIYTTYHHPSTASRNAKALAFCRDYGVPVLTLDTLHWSAKYQKQLSAAGIAVVINTIDSDAQAAKLRAQGVRFLQSNTMMGPFGATAAEIQAQPRAVTIAPSGIVPSQFGD